MFCRKENSSGRIVSQPRLCSHLSAYLAYYQWWCPRQPQPRGSDQLINVWTWTMSSSVRLLPGTAHAGQPEHNELLEPTPTSPSPLSPTSTSHRALDDMAEAADVLAVRRKKTLCFFLYSSIVKNFSCSAWKSRTTSPPFRMFSTFSLCSKKRFIFQLVWELTTLTSLHPGISRSSWLAATWRTWSGEKILNYLQMRPLLSLFAPDWPVVRRWQEWGWPYHPPPRYLHWISAVKTKCASASQARNQVWGYIKHQTLLHHHHQLKRIFNLQIPSNLNIIHPTSWPFFTTFQVHPEKNWDLKTATSDENYNLEDAGWKMFGMDELILIFCSRPSNIKHLTHFRFCFNNRRSEWGWH